MADEELMAFAKEIGAPYELVKETKELGRMPVVNFAAGGIATPADAALMMQLGVDGVFVGSGIFKSGDPAQARRGHRQGDDALPGRQHPGRSQQEPGRADGGPQRFADARSGEDGRTRLVEPCCFVTNDRTFISSQVYSD